MVIQYLSPEEITPYPNNPRTNKSAVKYVKQSLLDFGWRQPIVVDQNKTIIVGHTRYIAAKEMRMDKIPVYIAEDMSPEQAQAYRIADNKTSEYSFWDSEKLLKEISDIDLTGMFDMEDFGFATDLNSLNEFFEDATTTITAPTPAVQKGTNQAAPSDNIPASSPLPYPTPISEVIDTQPQSKALVVHCPYCGKEFSL